MEAYFGENGYVPPTSDYASITSPTDKELLDRFNDLYDGKEGQKRGRFQTVEKVAPRQKRSASGCACALSGSAAGCVVLFKFGGFGPARPATCNSSSTPTSPATCNSSPTRKFDRRNVRRVAQKPNRTAPGAGGRLSDVVSEGMEETQHLQ